MVLVVRCCEGVGVLVVKCCEGVGVGGEVL